MLNKRQEVFCPQFCFHSRHSESSRLPMIIGPGMNTAIKGHRFKAQEKRPGTNWTFGKNDIGYNLCLR